MATFTRRSERPAMRVILAVTGHAIRRQCWLCDVLRDVAGLAIEAAMGSRQGVARLRVVVVAPALPAVRVVAKCAIRPQPAFMMPVAVAGVAIQRRALELLRAMTFLARHDGMASDQRKSSDVVIEGGPAPAGVPVTLLAAITQLAFVSIILLMTRHARGRQLVAIEIAGMARVALDLRMPAFQRKFGLVMVEVGRFPLVLIVAGFAPGAVSSGVDILNLVTVHTKRADAFVAFARMAGGAGDGLVSALERKSGRVVVERLDPAPRGFAVAIIASFAKAPFMRVNRLVTVEAASARLAEFHRWRVAAGARHRSVRVAKREVREGVIERLTVQLDDVGLSSLVIGMTMVAFGFRGIGLAPVKSLAGRTIRRNFLMTR